MGGGAGLAANPDSHYSLFHCPRRAVPSSHVTRQPRIQAVSTTGPGTTQHALPVDAKEARAPVSRATLTSSSVGVSRSFYRSSGPGLGEVLAKPGAARWAKRAGGGKPQVIQIQTRVTGLWC